MQLALRHVHAELASATASPQEFSRQPGLAMMLDLLGALGSDDMPFEVDRPTYNLPRLTWASLPARFVSRSMRDNLMPS